LVIFKYFIDQFVKIIELKFVTWLTHLGQHFGVINGTVPLNLGHTKAKIDVLCGPDAMAMCVVWPRCNGTVPRCH